MAIDLVQKDIAVKSDSLAIRMKRGKLYEKFPRIDRQYLDDVFESYGLVFAFKFPWTSNC